MNQGGERQKAREKLKLTRKLTNKPLASPDFKEEPWNADKESRHSKSEQTGKQPEEKNEDSWQEFLLLTEY